MKIYLGIILVTGEHLICTREIPFQCNLCNKAIKNPYHCNLCDGDFLFIMDSSVPGQDTPHSPDARLARRTGPSRNEMGLAYHSQYDGIAHWPIFTESEPCVECNRDTNMCYIKCNISLCLKNNGENNCVINCFYHFHTTPKD